MATALGRTEHGFAELFGLCDTCEIVFIVLVKDQHFWTLWLYVMVILFFVVILIFADSSPKQAKASWSEQRNVSKQDVDFRKNYA